MIRARVTHAVKAAIAYGLYYSGLLQLWKSVVMRNRAVVLMYHRVLGPDDRRRTGSHPGIVVDRDTFAMQMAVVKRQFVVLSQDEFARRLESGAPFPSSSCFITFDDGWRDNFTNALPILRKHRLPALVFLPVNYIGSRRLFWREALTHMLVEAVAAARKEPARLPRLREILRRTSLGPILDLGGDPRPAIVEAVAAERGLDWTGARALLDALGAELGTRPEDLRTPDDFMGWEEVKTMSAQGIAFGGHGAEHRLLTELTADEADAEIRTARDVIAQELGTSVPTFSYPNGSLTPEIARQVQTCGYSLAFTTRTGFVSCDDDPFELRRVNIHEDVTNSTPMFLARVVGLF